MYSTVWSTYICSVTCRTRYYKDLRYIHTCTVQHSVAGAGDVECSGVSEWRVDRNGGDYRYIGVVLVRKYGVHTDYTMYVLCGYIYDIWYSVLG